MAGTQRNGKRFGTKKKGIEMKLGKATNEGLCPLVNFYGFMLQFHAKSNVEQKGGDDGNKLEALELC